MSKRGQGLPRPPRGRAPHEFPAIIEPPLRDMPAYPGPAIDGGYRRVESTPVEGLDLRQSLDRAQKVALADARVRKRLDGRRYAALGVSVLDDRKEQRGKTPAELLLYDYDAATCIAVELTAAEGEWVVAGLTETDYQPAPSEEELQEAIALARKDARVAARLEEGLVPMPILVSSVEPGDRHHGTRRIAVGFGREDERLARVQVMVDLAGRTILGVGVDLRHGAAEAEGFAVTEEGEGET